MIWGGRVANVTHSGPTGTIASRTYTRMPSGEPLRIDRVDEGEASARILNLDAAGRIETEHVDEGVGGVSAARHYAYDGDGNRLLRVLNEGTSVEVAESSSMTAGSELAVLTRTGASSSADTFAYDNVGRMTQLVREGVTCFVYVVHSRGED